ncbi:GAF and ANTAR domain-containing protein [Kribbella sp. CA-293567]|uniref:GAF and ANTAR domain-containing protein n=1 Tax=Kribbella sp. CA-293567 TaxID=3002436 RepID=UPI0022DD0057|nr:GAF and ANTAR domain-containing protein [Kribbella sp. CA-293567]WBQ08315.1 GAF and ANTAR domain-containing protein [Kribbella sp. CA-293567]
MSSRLDTQLPERAVQELATALSALVTDHDVLGTITNLLAGCERCLLATGSGIVISRPDNQELEFLAATSHRAEGIELYQAQTESGPAALTLATGEPVAADSTLLAGRWPEFAERFEAQGYHSLYAHPMRWRGQTFGALNLFFPAELVPAGTATVAQAFADIATVVILHSGTNSITHLIGQLRIALTDRIVIEQAKGVLAYTEDLTLDAAFDQLLHRARTSERSLSEVAAEVVDAVAHPSKS